MCLHHKITTLARSSRSRLIAVVTATALAALCLAALHSKRASSAPPIGQDIAGGGPIDHIYVSNDLSCQAAVAGDSMMSVYPPDIEPADCGTMLLINDTLFAPDFFSHDGTSTLFLGSYTNFTPVSQSGVLGTGTVADPYHVVTVVAAGNSGITLTQTDSYVSGDLAYRTDVAISNSGASPAHVLLYRAGECYLADSFESFGAVSTGGSPGCAASANDNPAGRLMSYAPVTPLDHHIEAWYRDVWSAIALHTNLPDTCACATLQPSGIALNWDRTVPTGGAVTLSHFTNFTTGAIPTETPTATATRSPTSTSTPAPTSTNTPLPTSTNTPPLTSTSTPRPTSTNAPLPTATNTPLPTSTNTPLPTSTNTPLPTSTNTPRSTSTNTPLPTSTGTPRPTSTSTPVPPTATRTSTMTPTATPSATATRPNAPVATSTPAKKKDRTPCADVSGDGRVTMTDIILIAQHTNKRLYDARYDLNGDGHINMQDIMIAARQLGTACRA